MLRVFAPRRYLIAAAFVLALSARAQAQEISGRPTLFFDADTLEKNQELQGGLHLGLSLFTPEFGPGFSFEAEISALAFDTTYSQSVPTSPGPGIGVGGLPTQFTQFYEAYEGPMDSGASVVDNSSYLTFAWRPHSWRTGEGLSLTVMPLHDARIYLGYEFPAVADFLPPPSGLNPGARLELRQEDWYVFAALKTNEVFNASIHETNRAVGELAGIGVDLFSAVRLELQQAHGDLGTNTDPQLLGKPLGLWGAAGRVEYHHGSVIGPPTDLLRYRDDPALWETVLRPEHYDDSLSAAVFGEALFLAKTGVSDPNEFGKTTTETAAMGAVEGRLKWRGTRGYLRLQIRSFSWVAPLSVIDTVRSGSEMLPELTGTLTVDHHFDSIGLTPGASFGICRPSLFVASTRGLSPTAEVRPLVFEPNGHFIILSPNTAVQPIYTGQATLRWDWRWVSLVSEMLLQYEPNLQPFQDTIAGVTNPFPERTVTYTVYLFAQSRFE